MNTVTVTHSLDDDDGTPIVSVPLINSKQIAILNQSDYQELISIGVDPRWKLARSQVFERGRTLVSIARLIANAKKGEKVQYKDGNQLNLRRKNLVISIGAGKHTERDRLNKEHGVLRDKVEVKHNHKLPSWEVAQSLRSR